MSVECNTKLIVLWEHELRAAARLVREAMQAMERAIDNHDNQTLTDAAQANSEAVLACACALDGLDEDHPVAMLSSAQIREMVAPAAPAEGCPADGGAEQAGGDGASSADRGNGWSRDLLEGL